MSRLLSLVIGALSLLSLDVSAAQSGPFSGDQFTVVVHKTFETVTLTFDTRSRPSILPTDFDAYMASAPVHFGLGEENGRRITSVKLEWGGLPAIFLAESAFTDLHTPRFIAVEQKGGNLLATITGGDAASSYRASIEIAPYGVISRTAYNVISGHEQRATYTYPISTIEGTMKGLKKIRERNLPK